MFRWWRRLWSRSETQQRIDVLEEQVIILQSMVDMLVDRLNSNKTIP